MMLRIRKNLSLLRSYSRQLNSVIDIKPEVLDALKSNKPVVALESTIITHGMPYPRNLQTAIEVENIVRSQVDSYLSNIYRENSSDRIILVEFNTSNNCHH